MISEEEFLTEAAAKNTDTAKTAYGILSELVQKKALSVFDVYQYARFKWCLNNPQAIVACQESRDKWRVNNCDTEISEETARIKICECFGFEASRLQIVGTPYYDATDSNFIHFNCMGYDWLMQDGGIYQLYQ